MKLAKTLRLNGKLIPKGTVLNFGTEGYATYMNMRIAKSQIPEAAVEHVSQRRDTVELQRTIRLNQTTIPRGTVLNFGTEGLANYGGISISKAQIPALALGATESAVSPVVLKTACAVNGKVIPANETLMFNEEGMATYAGESVSIYDIPTDAINMDAVATESAVSPVVLKMPCSVNGSIIPANETLMFNEDGVAEYAGESVSIYDIPTAAIEMNGDMTGASEAFSPVKLKMSCSVNGNVIPANETLMFDNEGHAEYAGESVSIYDIPTAAIEMNVNYSASHNAIDPESTIKAFDAIEPGDGGFDQFGKPVRFLGKAMGKKGYNDLVNQFGNVSDCDLKDLTVGLSDEEIEAIPFVACSTRDDSVEVCRYGAEYTSAVESENAQVEDICEVQSGDKAINYDGKPCTIVAKGQGKVWHDNMVETLGLDNCIADIRKALGVDDDDPLQTTWFVLVTNDKNEKCVCNYGKNGAYVMEEANDND
jgi:hypothetical protein